MKAGNSDNIDLQSLKQKKNHVKNGKNNEKEISLMQKFLKPKKIMAFLLALLMVVTLLPAITPTSRAAPFSKNQSIDDAILDKYPALSNPAEWADVEGLDLSG